MAITEVGSLDRAVVQTAVNNAAAGDTLILPSGNGTWTNAGSGVPCIDVPLPITIEGAGQGLTNLSITPGTGWMEVGFYMNPFASGLFSLGKMTITGTSSGFGMIYMDDARQFRIHHITFNGISGRSIITRDRTYGLIDNCIWQGANQQAIYVGAVFLEDKWAMVTPINTVNGVVYIEDNDFNDATFGDGTVDATEGACFVYRHNLHKNTEIGCHGLDSIALQRSTRWFEIYSNTFTTDNAFWRAIGLRGGSGVIYDNVFTGAWGTVLQLCCYRACLAYSFGLADGSNPIDGNDDAEGWPARDQIGRGQDAFSWTNFRPNMLGPYPTQASEPLYQWGNELNSVPITAAIHNFDPCFREALFIQEGRDYHDNTEMPAYGALTYPHPLQGAGETGFVNNLLMVFK